MLHLVAASEQNKAGTGPVGVPVHDEAAYAMFVTDGISESITGFDRHIVASILALGYADAISAGLTFSDTTGLDEIGLEKLLGDRCNRTAALQLTLAGGPVLRGADEACLLDLLTGCASRSPLSHLLAAMIARRAQSPNHLWQDLGLRSRDELSELMRRHFRTLADRNVGDMKWKKFLYRMICRDADYSICTAPSCSECSDFEHCFGDESGESLLARVRRTAELDSIIAGI